MRPRVLKARLAPSPVRKGCEVYADPAETAPGRPADLACVIGDHEGQEMVVVLVPPGHASDDVVRLINAALDWKPAAG